MKCKYYLILAALVCLSASLYAQSQNVAATEVLVVNIDEDLPVNVKKIGSVKMGDNMRFSCGYEKTLIAVQEKAANLGGTIIKITKHKKPDMMSTCHRLWADVYITKGGYKPVQEEKEAEKPWKGMIPDTADYALLCLYRPGYYSGSLLNIRVHIEDSLVSRMRNNSRQTVKIYKEGPVKIWAVTEKRSEVDLDIKHGQVYFISCEMGMGIAIGRPHLHYVKDKQRAYREFWKTKRELTKTDNNNKE